MPSDPRARALQLIELACNAGASSEEARTAAFAAVQLIREHKLLLSGAPAPRSGFQPGGMGFTVDFGDLVNAMQKAAQQRANAHAQQRAQEAQRQCPVCSKTVPTSESSFTNQVTGKVYHRDCAHHGPCSVCGLACYVKDKPVHVVGAAWRHATCSVQPRIIVEQSAPYACTCHYCDDPIVKGDRVWSVVGRYFEHATCHEVRLSGAGASGAAKPAHPKTKRTG